MRDVSIHYEGRVHRFTLELVRQPFLVGAHFFQHGDAGTVPFVGTVCGDESPYFEELAGLSDQSLADLCIGCFAAPGNFERAMSGIPGKIVMVLPLQPQSHA